MIQSFPIKMTFATFSFFYVIHWILVNEFDHISRHSNYVFFLAHLAPDSGDPDAARYMAGYKPSETSVASDCSYNVADDQDVHTAVPTIGNRNKDCLAKID